MITSWCSPVSIRSANRSTWRQVRSTSPRSRASDRPVSAVHTATISSTRSRSLSAMLLSIATRASPRKRSSSAAAAAAANSASSSSPEVSGYDVPGAPVAGSTAVRVAESVMSLTLACSRASVLEAVGERAGDDQVLHREPDRLEHGDLLGVPAPDAPGGERRQLGGEPGRADHPRLHRTHDLPGLGERCALGLDRQQRVAEQLGWQLAH